jgi:hypothetical protein
MKICVTHDNTFFLLSGDTLDQSLNANLLEIFRFRSFRFACDFFAIIAFHEFAMEKVQKAFGSLKVAIEVKKIILAVSVIGKANFGISKCQTLHIISE